MVTERPCHEAEGDLLSVHPVGAGVGWIMLYPVFDESPEGFGVFFVVSGGVGADEGVDEGKAVGFPDVLYINMSLRGGLLPFPTKQSPVTRRLLRQKPRAPRSDIIIGELGPVFGGIEFDARDGVFMPIRRKTCFDKFVGKVFYFAFEDSIGFFDGGLFIPWNIFR